MRKEWWRLMSPRKSGDEVHETILKKAKKREEPKKKKKRKQKNERKREKGQCYYPFSTLLL